MRDPVTQLLYPVIMCGGAGSRLWPASRPSRPKQFIPLAGNRSLFQETAMRVAGLAEGGGRLIVVAGVGHRTWIVDQLEEIGIEAQLLLEPEARDSAAAMAAAAAWTQQRDPDGVNAFVASDHHIPDHEAFRQAVRVAAAEAATAGRIVTLGVRPTEPSSAYGYIKPQGEGLSAVAAFVEKPDTDTAARHVAAGYLWNSGNFIVGATTLVDELRLHAPAVEAAARAALPDGGGSILTLGPAFGGAPKISIDYAVMEHTRRAAVLPVDFAWSDLGAWDAIHATGEGDFGMHVLEDAEGCLVRAPEGVMVAALGVRNLAIVAERDAILVCDLSRSQEVKRVVERLRATAPQHLDFDQPAPETLEAGAGRLADWLRLRALPLWAAMGQTADGTFVQAISADGRAFAGMRHLRVQARQIQAFAEAGRLGWTGPWRRCVNLGLARLFADHLEAGGTWRATLTADGAPLDEPASADDLAVVLTALAAARAVGADHDDLDARAAALRDGLAAGNADLRLLEASLAWEVAGGDRTWVELTDSLSGQAPAAHAPGGAGSDFERAWLLARTGARRRDPALLRAALELNARGRFGVNEGRQVVADAAGPDGAPDGSRRRLRAQADWLRSTLILSETAGDGDRGALLQDAAAAQRAVWTFLTPDGLWCDRLDPSHSPPRHPASALSLHRLVACLGQLAATAEHTGLRGIETAPLA